MSLRIHMVTIHAEIQLCVFRETQAPNLFNTLTRSADPPMLTVASVRIALVVGDK